MAEGSAALTVTDSGLTLPAVEILTGRGFVTGKSGSGKSNTASVVIEELLSQNLPVFVVDTDGEYYGLKEQFEVLHAGADEDCDVQVSATDGDELARVALEENVPVVLDLSAFLDRDVANRLLESVVQQLFLLEGKLKKPFLLVVEEAHEYIPQSGGGDEVSELLLRVAKRGRKRGLGMCAISQRPAAVDKDYITQCDWLVWHRLTWNNDTKVVGDILSSEYAKNVEDLGDGEAFLMTDWDESVRRIQFRRKRTFDAGATPDLDAARRTSGGIDREALSSLGVSEDADLGGPGSSIDDGAGDDAAAGAAADIEAVADAGAGEADAPAEGEGDGAVADATDAGEMDADADGTAGDADEVDADADAADDANGGTSGMVSSVAAAASSVEPVSFDGPAAARGGTVVEDGPVLESEPVENEAQSRNRRVAPEATDDPVWEVGQLAAHVTESALAWTAAAIRAFARGLVAATRWTARASRRAAHRGAVAVRGSGDDVER